MGLPIWDPFNNERISKPINNISNFYSKRNKTNSIPYKHCPSPGQNYICVENKMTNNGPMMVTHGLSSSIGPISVLFGHCAQILPIWDPIGHACWGGQKSVVISY